MALTRGKILLEAPKLGMCHADGDSDDYDLDVIYPNLGTMIRTWHKIDDRVMEIRWLGRSNSRWKSWTPDLMSIGKCRKTRIFTRGQEDSTITNNGCTAEGPTAGKYAWRIDSDVGENPDATLTWTAPADFEFVALAVRGDLANTGGTLGLAKGVGDTMTLRFETIDLTESATKANSHPFDGQHTGADYHSASDHWVLIAVNVKQNETITLSHSGNGTTQVDIRGFIAWNKSDGFVEPDATESGDYDPVIMGNHALHGDAELGEYNMGEFAGLEDDGVDRDVVHLMTFREQKGHPISLRFNDGTNETWWGSPAHAGTGYDLYDDPNTQEIKYYNSTYKTGRDWDLSAGDRVECDMVTIKASGPMNYRSVTVGTYYETWTITATGFTHFYKIVFTVEAADSFDMCADGYPQQLSLGDHDDTVCHSPGFQDSPFKVGFSGAGSGITWPYSDRGNEVWISRGGYGNIVCLWRSICTDYSGSRGPILGYQDGSSGFAIKQTWLWTDALGANAVDDVTLDGDVFTAGQQFSVYSAKNIQFAPFGKNMKYGT